MIRPPIVGAAVWLPVMTAAEYRCQCQGACGSKHTPVGERTPGAQHRCARQLGQYVHGRGLEPLVVAPTDPDVAPHVAATTPTEQLRAWCPACYSGAVRAARRAKATEPELTEQLFDMPTVARPAHRPGRARRSGDAA
jgi:hypothetical protein